MTQPAALPSAPFADFAPRTPLSNPLISTLGQLHGAHILHGGITHHHAACNGLPGRFSAQHLHGQLERASLAINAVLGFRHLPFPAVAFA